MQMIFAFVDQCEWLDWFFGTVAISLAVWYIFKLISEHNDRRKNRGYFVKPRRKTDYFSDLYSRRDKFL